MTLEHKYWQGAHSSVSMEPPLDPRTVVTLLIIGHSGLAFCMPYIVSLAGFRYRNCKIGLVSITNVQQILHRILMSLTVCLETSQEF